MIFPIPTDGCDLNFREQARILSGYDKKCVCERQIINNEITKTLKGISFPADDADERRCLILVCVYERDPRKKNRHLDCTIHRLAKHCN
jgi:hypothetical protein